MRLFIAVTLLSLSTSVFAGRMWKKIAEDREIAHNLQEFLKLQKKYPEALKNVDTTNLTRGLIEIDTWEYVGATVCNMDDPRLLFKGFSVFTCYNSGSGE